MRLPLRFWEIATHLPTLFHGAALHRAGLRAAAAGRFELADRLFEAAADHYREHLCVPELARLRVHQMMVRADASRATGDDTALELAGEIARRALALDAIEDLAPPFARIRPEQLLARWTHRFAAADAEARAA